MTQRAGRTRDLAAHIADGYTARAPAVAQAGACVVAGCTTAFPDALKYGKASWIS